MVTPLNYFFHILGFTFKNCFYMAVRSIFYPTGHMMGQGLFPGSGPKPYPLDKPFNYRMFSYFSQIQTSCSFNIQYKCILNEMPKYFNRGKKIIFSHFFT